MHCTTQHWNQKGYKSLAHAIVIIIAGDADRNYLVAIPFGFENV